MNGLQDWREWRESVDRALTRLADAALIQTEVIRKLLERVEALEQNYRVSVTEQPVNVIDPVPQMVPEQQGDCEACKRRNMMMFFVDPGPCPVCGAKYGTVGGIDLPTTKKEWVKLDADVAAKVRDRIAQSLDAAGFWDAPTIVESSP